ncbi:hypothetical protein J3R30DRAFT_3319011 [Lentinula aciculospora]|uniref:Uncharacterized protein n=1 Tax=Lentinula aciculospora TaxID=153920 RepID=A0A9W9DE28_9AGAR|nr:hypothetical protein J3R30DRAFT_3319011 [Lentinula aciculospora]
MQKALGSAFTSLLEGNGWQKLSKPTTTRGATAIPRSPTAVARIGLRLDYNNFIEKDEGEEKVKWHQYKLQVNAGDTIPHTFKNWRDKQEKGTHAVMATVEIRDGADKDEIEAALKEATKDVQGA